MEEDTREIEDKIKEIEISPTTSETESIKSAAIVKYSAPKPAQFMRLQCNTDLNLPPTNWLSNSADSYGLHHVLYQPQAFSSFRMANMFPDCIGDVDVVSDAENIKKLLKIPYQRGQVSMMVHRVGNTLLLDNYDIYKHLLQNAATEWKWLRKFFFENVKPNVTLEGRNIYIKTKRRKALKEKSLVSKFLYHSLGQNADDSNAFTEDNATALPLPGPLLPEPAPASEVPDPDSSFKHKYNRNVVWTFEDIEMLIGTDLPIFGGGTHPCISLRLRDMNKPINVLTGIDYWLDNLMSNVPEVVMCYHLNGIVKKYELIKTEDLPMLDDSKFSPKLIREVAQSILSFLKSNATKAGHTYWLFKGKDEEVVKLYDLTSLYTEEPVDNDQNPFTIPVAMLLYRVARNMKISKEKKQSSTIRMLLINCIQLLPEEKYPEIVTSCHYMLSDLYIPQGTEPENPILDPPDADETESVYDDDIDDIPVDEEDGAAKILILDSKHYREKFHNHYKAPSPISQNIADRCVQAILHIAAGINCLKFFKSDEEKPKPKEQEIPMAKPHEPIPMPYSEPEEVKLDEKKGAKKKEKKKKTEKPAENTQEIALLLKSQSEAQTLPTWQATIDNIIWKDHLKVLLYEKSILVYATLAEFYFITRDYGDSLRCIGLLTRCMLIFNKLSNIDCVRENCLIGRAGDCCLMIAQNWTELENHKYQLHTHLEGDLKMIEQLEKDEQYYNINIGESNKKCVFIYDILSKEQMFLNSVACYEEALKCFETNSIQQRLGNSLNEMGTFYLNIAKASSCDADAVHYSRKAKSYLKRGLEIFEKIKDQANIALLCTNLGHLSRLMAYRNKIYNKPGEKYNLVEFKKCILNYRKALNVLGCRQKFVPVWDAVTWELFSSLYNMACDLHENPSSNVSKAEAEKEVVEMLQKALQSSDMDETRPKFPLYQSRVAELYFRLGTLYHSNIYTSSSTEGNRKHIIQLAKINYEKASKLYYIFFDAVNHIKAELQWLALNEYLAETSTMSHLKLKHLQNCLPIMLSLLPIVEQLHKKKIKVTEEERLEFQKLVRDQLRNAVFNSCGSLLLLTKQRLQFVLKSLIKLTLNKPPINKDCSKLMELYKECYTFSFSLEKIDDFHKFLGRLRDSLSKIKNKLNEFDAD